MTTPSETALSAERAALYRGRVSAFDAVLAKVREWNGNGHDEPSDPALDEVLDYVTDLRSRATAALTIERAAARSQPATEGLREALTEWDAIEGSSLADQFRGFIAAGKMADAIRAALTATEPAGDERT